MTEPTRKNVWGLLLIGGFKFVSGLLLVGLGVGLFRNVNADPGEEIGHITSALKLDPDNHYIHQAITWVTGLSPRQLKAISVGTFLYALMYLIEGTGLLLRKRWGEYFTVIATGFFIPLEIYEVIRRPTVLRITIFAINVAIVVYLVYQVMKSRREAAGASHNTQATSHSA